MLLRRTDLATLNNKALSTASGLEGASNSFEAVPDFGSVVLLRRNATAACSHSDTF